MNDAPAKWSIRCLPIALLLSPLQAQDAAAIYRARCAGCHDAGVGRAPRREALQQMSPEQVLTALTGGSMIVQGAALTNAEIHALASFITGKPFGNSGMPKQAFCVAPPAAFTDPFSASYWNGWGVDLTNRRFQPAPMARLGAGQVAGLKLKWAFAIPGAMRAYAQPTVAGGRVYIGTATRQVFSLDADSGCIYWVYDADAGVRTAITIGRSGARWAAYFGDQRAHAYALGAAHGELLWKTRVDEFPAAMVTGAPALYEGRLYVPVSSYEEVVGAAPNYECCRFRGSVVALDAATGRQIWKAYTIPEPPRPVRKNQRETQLWGPSGAGVWSSPTIDTKRRALYVATGDSYSDPPARTSDAFVAFDLDSGKMLWSRQLLAGDAFNLGCASPERDNCPEAKGPDFDFGSSPILVNLSNGKRALIAGQKSGMVHAVDPDQQGEMLWQTRVGVGGALGGVQWGSAADERNVYVAVSDVRSRPARGPGNGAHRSLLGYSILDPAAGGGMFALSLLTGERVWHTPPPGCGGKAGCSPAQSAAVTVIPGVVFSGALDGHLRAYSTESGRILWDFDTARSFVTVNGVEGGGGSIDGPGPVVAGGAVYTNSGYGLFGGMPGNVLLAFTPEGR